MILQKFYPTKHWKKQLSVVNYLLRFSVISRQLSSMDSDDVLSMIRKGIPPLLESKYKGQAGRIAVIGGSKEYTGAPYFAAISALKTGCDLSHVFCPTEASQVIKSYSPELIVHPLLDKADALEEFVRWLPKLHCLVIGPGLERDDRIFATVKMIISKAKEKLVPLVIDADGLWLITKEPEIIQRYPLAILTPNAIEFSRLYKKVIGNDVDLSNITSNDVQSLALSLAGPTICAKGQHDIISDGKQVLSCTLSGSARRCGGQGDLLCGSLGTFLHWMTSYFEQLTQNKSDPMPYPATFLAAYAACNLTRKCSNLAFETKNRHMMTTDMIGVIPQAFSALFCET